MAAASSPRARRHHGLDRLARFVPAITAKAFSKFGFAHHEIARYWPEIVGEEIARFASPERIRWPRHKGGRAQHEGGTLVIRVDGPRAIEIQHSTDRIIERVNGYYGYRAIAAIKLIQGPLDKRREASRPVQEPTNPASAPPIRGIEDAGLKAALSRLGRNLLRSQSK
jgi:hypothetical protein